MHEPFTNTNEYNIASDKFVITIKKTNAFSIHEFLRGKIKNE